MVDVHTHVFPPRIGPRLAAAIAREFGREPAGDGSAENLASHLAEAGLTHAVCFTAALRPDQMIPANSWMIALRRTHPHLIPLGTVHPGHPAWETELDRLERSGVSGLKVHPDLAGIPLHAPAWEPVWEAVRGRFLVVVHMGPIRPGEATLSHPMTLAAVLDRHRGLEVVAAHLGGLGLWEDTLEHLAGREIYMDTSCCHDAIPVAALAALMKRHDRGRILFGSDYPLFSPKTERPALASLLAKLRVPEHVILDNGTALARRLQHGGFAGPAPSPDIDIS